MTITRTNLMGLAAVAAAFLAALALFSVLNRSHPAVGGSAGPDPSPGAVRSTDARIATLQSENLAPYARVSYLRELHGDLAGALAAMQDAVAAGGDEPENVAYVQSLLGDLQFQRGDLAAARVAYGRAAYEFPGYAPAIAGLARVDAARGRLGPAIARLRGVVERLPLPQYVIALGEDELAAGRGAAAERDLALVGVERRLLPAAGGHPDRESAV